MVSPWRHDWYSYGFGLFTAITYGVWARKRYRVTVLHRYEGGTVVWSVPTPVHPVPPRDTPGSSAPSASSAPPSQFEWNHETMRKRATSVPIPKRVPRTA